MARIDTKQKRQNESKRDELIEVITNEWGFTYNEGKFDPTCRYNGFWFKDLGNDTFLIICYGGNCPENATYIFDLFRCIYPANAKMGYSQPLRNPQRLKLGIDLEQDREKMEKVLINPLEITEVELLEE